MNKINLTNQEQKVALDYAIRLEKRSGQWIFLRWIVLGCFVFGLVLLLAVSRLSEQMRSVTQLPPEVLEHNLTPTPELNQSLINLLNSQIDVKIVILRTEIYLAVQALITAGIGASLFVYVISNWKRHEQDRLVAKLLRSLASLSKQKNDKQQR